MPAAAPTASNLEQPVDAADFADYFIVPLTPPVVEIMGDRPSAGFPAAFHLAGYRGTLALRPGDIIGITVFENGGPSVFGMGGPVPGQVGQVADAGPAIPNLDVPQIDWGSAGPSRRPPSASVGVQIASANNSFVPASVVRVDSGSGFSLPSGPAPTPSPAGPGQLLAQTPPITTPTPSSAPPPSPTPLQPLAPSKTTSFPPLTIEADGRVLIPYVGSVMIGGLTSTEAAERIKAALSRQALNPQVLVSLVNDRSSLATVGGEANRPGPVTLSLRGERLLDVVGQAGGSKWPAPDTEVDIVRGSRTAKVTLQTIVDHPAENISVRPDDQIFLTHDPRSFTVLGATSKVSQYTFDVPKVSLGEAIGRAGGAIDTIGNPAAVYLFRDEPRDLAGAVLNTVPSAHRLRTARDPITTSRIQMVYRIDMTSAEGYFISRKVMMRDKDVLLIANAEGAQLLKVFTLARGLSGIASDLNLFGIGGPLGSSTGLTTTK